MQLIHLTSCHIELPYKNETSHKLSMQYWDQNSQGTLSTMAQMHQIKDFYLHHSEVWGQSPLKQGGPARDTTKISSLTEWKKPALLQVRKYSKY